MGRGQDKLTDQIRRAIDANGMSRYRICKLVGMSEATMSRFMSGKGGLSMKMLDRLGAALNLKIVADKAGGGRKGGTENGKRDR